MLPVRFIQIFRSSTSPGMALSSGPQGGVANSILLEKPFALAQLVTAVSQLLNEPVLLSVAPDPKPRTSTD